MPVTRAQMKQIALGFPGALEKPSYGKPAFFIEKKFFTRLREQDGSIVMRVGSIEQRDMMLELDPDTYFITDHYKDWAGVLVRLSAISPGELKIMLERVWRQIAPKKLQREMDGEAVSPAKKKAAHATANPKPVAKRKAPAAKEAVRTKPAKATRAKAVRKAKR